GVLGSLDAKAAKGWVSVMERAVVISAGDETKVYGYANTSIGGAISGGQWGAAVWLSYSTGADATSGVGSYAIVPHANGTDAVLRSEERRAGNAWLSRTKPALLNTEADKTKVYGDANPTYTGSISGGQNRAAGRLPLPTIA